MYPTSHIWSDATWNPVAGCSAISTGCNLCYAARLAGTQQTAHQIPIHLGTTDWVRGKPVFNAKMTALEAGHDRWTWPLDWPGAPDPLLGKGKPSLIFVCDMCDLFHENRPTEIIDRVISTIAWSPHIGQLLTKRPERMAKYANDPARWGPNQWRHPERVRRITIVRVWQRMTCEHLAQVDQP
jgi:protein gp37